MRRNAAVVPYIERHLVRGVVVMYILDIAKLAIVLKIGNDKEQITYVCMPRF